MVCSVDGPMTAFLIRNYVTKWVAERSDKDARCEKFIFYIRPTNILCICNFTLSELTIVNHTNIYLRQCTYKRKRKQLLQI
jgi:hypothetical protein